MKTLLCADFEFYDEIYSKIPCRNLFVEMDYVTNGEDALDKLKEKKYDYLISTIVMPKLDGLELVDKVQADPDKFGTPKIAYLTGLGGEEVFKRIIEKQVDYIDRFEREITKIEEDIDLFLGHRIEKMTFQYPIQDVESSFKNQKLQKEEQLPGLLELHRPIKCSNCNEMNMKWIRFVSPKETWKLLCGRDSCLLICTDCFKQYEQVIRIMN